jgi:hypothetical protein
LGRSKIPTASEKKATLIGHSLGHSTDLNRTASTGAPHARPDALHPPRPPPAACRLWRASPPRPPGALLMASASRLWRLTASATHPGGRSNLAPTAATYQSLAARPLWRLGRPTPSSRPHPPNSGASPPQPPAPVAAPTWRLPLPPTSLWLLTRSGASAARRRI